MTADTTPPLPASTLRRITPLNLVEEPRDVVEAAEQYLETVGEPSYPVVAALLIKYGGAKQAILKEAHAALRGRLERNDRDRDPAVANLMWMVTKELAETFGLVHDEGDAFVSRLPQPDEVAR